MANWAGGDVFLLLPLVLLSIHGWLRYKRSRSGYNRTPTKTGTGKRRERALKDYATNGGRPPLYRTISE